MSETTLQRTESREVAIPQSQGLNLQTAIETAVQLGPDGVDVLERLVTLAENQSREAARQAFNRAVAEMSARMGSVKKNRSASFATKSGAKITYKYADLHQIAKAIREAGAGDLGLSWSWNTKVHDASVEVTCKLSHVGGHSDTATFVAPIDEGTRLTSGPQKVKIATTYAQRVSLGQVFGITDTDDDLDGIQPESQGATVSPEQALELEAKLREVSEKEGRSMDQMYSALLKWAGADSIEEFPAVKFSKTMSDLSRRAK